MSHQLTNLLPDPNRLPFLVDTALLAQLTGFAEQTLRHWANKTRQPPRGWPEPIRIGRNVRYRTSQIIDWIEGTTAPNTELQEPPFTPRRGRGRPRKMGGDG